ncbi:MAG TPA: hypothetical protein PLJ21_12085, partial [Pseudobdellovibrionaceae bacterium]|nr:hypothetical protein [Pseudobdellovibrionaceae bacterium]
MYLRKYLIIVLSLFFFKVEAKEFEKTAFNTTLAKVSNIVLTSRHVVLSNHLNNALNEASSEENIKTFDISSNKTME